MRTLIAVTNVGEIHFNVWLDAGKVTTTAYQIGKFTAANLATTPPQFAGLLARFPLALAHLAALPDAYRTAYLDGYAGR